MAKIKLSDIKLNADNPRVKNDHKFEQLVKSIADFPKMLKLRKLILRSRDDKTVIAGNMRRQALEELGYKEIPEEWVDYADEMTEDEVREFIIKDNLSFGEWDWPTLQADWDTDELSEWGLDVPVFAEMEEPDFDDLIGENKNKPPTMKITFESPEQLQAAENDIQELIDRKYKGAFYSVSAGEI